MFQGALGQAAPDSLGRFPPSGPREIYVGVDGTVRMPRTLCSGTETAQKRGRSPEPQKAFNAAPRPTLQPRMSEPDNTRPRDPAEERPRRSDMYTRRKLLAGVGCSGIAVLSGCSASNRGSGQPVTLEANNYTQTERTIVVEAVSEQADDRSSGTLFSREIELPAEGFGNDGYVNTEAFPARPAVVKIRFSNAARFGVVAHYHFVPDCQDGGDTSDTVIIQLTEDDGDELPVVSFRRTTCESL